MLEDRKPIKIVKDGMEVVLVRARDKVFAFEPYCPHKGGSMEYGDIVEVRGKECIRCHLHGYIFELEGGKLLTNPPKKTEWYNSRDLKVFKLKIVGEEVHLDL